jgi:hypothetical protein
MARTSKRCGPGSGRVMPSCGLPLILKYAEDLKALGLI